MLLPADLPGVPVYSEGEGALNLGWGSGVVWEALDGADGVHDGGDAGG